MTVGNLIAKRLPEAARHGWNAVCHRDCIIPKNILDKYDFVYKLVKDQELVFLSKTKDNQVVVESVAYLGGTEQICCVPKKFSYSLEE